MAPAERVERARFERCPAVAVLCTPAAAQECRLGGAHGVARALSARGRVRGLNAPVRTSPETPAYRLPDFAVRFVAAADVRACGAQVAEERVGAVLSAAAAALSEPGSLPTAKRFCLQRAAHAADVDAEYMPWLGAFRDALGDVLAFSEVEAFDHPVAALCVATTECEGAPQALRAMYGAPRVPIPLADGTMDPNVERYYLLVHDPDKGTSDERAAALLRECQAAVGGAACHLLRLAPAGVGGTGGGAPPQQQQGADPVAAYVSELVARHLIPYLERRVRAIDHHVSSTRKGMMNSLKNRWRKAADTREGSGGGTGGQHVAYPAGSSEATLRLAGDLAFMLRDYSLAAGNYSLLLSDYKVDRAWAHLGAAHEARAMALLLTDGARREAEAALVEALEAYRRVPARATKTEDNASPAPLVSLLAARAALALADLYASRGAYREAGRELCRAADHEAGLASAILRERGALLAARAPTSLRRHAGFQMVLAGFRYAQAGQRAHAMRTYAATQRQFDGGRWRFIHDHIHATLGRHAAHLGDHVLASSHFSRLLGAGHQSVATQQSFMNEFLYVLKSARKKAGEEALGTEAAPMALPLPHVNVGRYSVHFQDWRSRDGVEGEAVREAEWAAIEEVVAGGEGSGAPNWMEAAAGRGHSKQEEPMNRCVAGEDVTVLVQLHNVTGLPVELSKVRLSCELRRPEERHDAPPRPGHVRAASEPAFSLQAPSGGGGERLHKVESESELQLVSGVECPEEAISLNAGERVTLRLRCRPLEEGTLRVLGVEWTLAGQARGHAEFERPRRPPGKDLGTNSGVSPHRRLAFYVSPPAPRLQCSLQGLPPALMQGQLCRTTLTLTNVGAVPLHGLKLVAGDGAVAQPGRPGDPIEGLDAQMGVLGVGSPRGQGPPDEHIAVAAAACAPSEELARAEGAPKGCPSRAFALLAEGASLAPKRSVTVPIWLRAPAPANGAAGTTTRYRLLLSALYAPARSAGAPLSPPELRRMALRIARAVDVAPSLSVRGAVVSSAADAERAMLRLDLHNIGTGAVSLRQLSVRCRAAGVVEPVAAERMPRELPPGGAASVLCTLRGGAAAEGEGAECVAALAAGRGPGQLDGSAIGELWRRARAAGKRGGSGCSGAPGIDCAVVWGCVDAFGSPGGGGAGVSTARCAAPVPARFGGVRCTLRAPPVVSHDFGVDGTVARVACSVRVHNAGACPATCRLRLLPAPASSGGRWLSQSATLTPARSATYTWVGRTGFDLGEIGAGESREVPVALVVLAPGVFNLDTYEVCWKAAGGEIEERVAAGRAVTVCVGTGGGADLLPPTAAAAGEQVEAPSQPVDDTATAPSAAASPVAVTTTPAAAERVATEATAADNAAAEVETKDETGSDDVAWEDET